MDSVIEEIVDPLLEKIVDHMVMGNRMLLPVIGKEANPRVRCLDFNLDDSNFTMLPALSPKKKPVPSGSPMAKITPAPSTVLPSLSDSKALEIQRKKSNDENV